MKRILAIVIIVALCLCDSAMVFGAETVSGFGETENQNKTETKTLKSGTPDTNMPTNELMFLTLADNTAYRWNVNDSGGKNSEVHLDDASGENCNFRFDSVEDGYYGIKHIKSGGTDRFVDVDGKSTKEGAVLHVFENDDDELGGSSNYHRHFKFYYQRTDSHGNKVYKIQIRKSGLWVGYEDTDKNGKPSYGDKLIQTSEEKGAEWIITKEVVPKSGREAEDLVASGDAAAFCEIFKAGTIESLNRVDDSSLNGTRIHTYTIGTSSKWLIEWIEEYEAYEIRAVTEAEDVLNSVWDVTSQSGKDGAAIHLWKSQSRDRNQNTSSLWRFIENTDGHYYIQNARSGKYVRIHGLDDQIEQDSESSVFEVSLISGMKSVGANELGAINFSYANPWMSNLPDDALLSSVNLPGTHDTGTAAIVQGGIPQISLTSCQKYYYGEQLNVGTRAFDIRCNATGKDIEDVKIIHGSEFWQCYDRDGSELTLADILDDSVRFLSEHDSEALVMMVKPDDGSSSDLAYALYDFISANRDHVWTGGGIPTLEEARGKIVFMHRFTLPDGLAEYSDWFGLDLADWDDYSYGEASHALSIYDKDNVHVYAQDAYNAPALLKLDYIWGTMKQTTGNDANHKIAASSWVYNYTSSAMIRPLETSRRINPQIFEDKPGYIDKQRLGIIMFNFVDAPMARLIYETNNTNSDFYEIKVQKPSVSITYGQSLSQATLSGGSSDGTWTFADGDYVPDFNDYSSEKTFEITYTPDNSALKPVTEEVSIDEFHKKNISVTIDDQEITYGDALPEWSYSLEQNELVGDDTEADLGLVFELENQSSDELMDAGKYAITGKSSSDNYNVTFDDGELTVKQKTVGIQWSDTGNLVYTGSPVHVTAELTGVLDGDDCSPVIEGGSETEPSWDGTSNPPQKYTAVITALSGGDKNNYSLPEDGTSINYYIRRKNADDFVFPESATLTYGQSLSEAELYGQSGDGTFIFMKNGKPATDEKPHAGKYEYNMVYIPENTEDEHLMAGTVTVTVNPLAVTAEADAVKKTYGDETQLTFTMDEKQLVNGDTIDDLNIVLTAGDGDKKDCDAGVYKITEKEYKNTNYTVTVKPSVLVVSRREAVISWNGQKTYQYNGSSVNITANVDNCVNPGECEAKVVNGTRKDAGNYTAVVTGLTDKRNYSLPDDASQLTYTYEIQRSEPAVIFPDSATVTYGETLDQAVFSGGSGDGQFCFNDEDGGELLTVADSGKEYELQFIPSDTENYKTVTGKVKVTVNPKPVTVEIDDKEKTYGQSTPDYTWHMEESQLVGTDSVDDFKLELTAGEGNNETCDAGIYQITGSVITQNENYDVGFKNGKLTVDPLVADIVWSSTTNIKVGDPAPSASIANLVGSDQCTLEVESDGTSEPSWRAGENELKIFEAKITGITGADQSNYILPEDGIEKQYLVRRINADDYNMPSQVVMTYGENYGDAEMVLASGDGTFTVVDRKSYQDISGQSPENAGTFTCMVKYTPEDSTKQPVFQEAELLVEPKPVKAVAEDGEKIYGEETELTFTMDANQLVGEDTIDGLGLTLTAVNTEGSDKSDGDSINSPAGTYIIEKKSCKNSNYDVTVISATYWIRQKTVTVIWSDVSNLYYTGEPVNVTACPDGLINGDKAEIAVLNGNRVEVGTYRAIAQSISNDSYRLDNTEKAIENRIKEYTIHQGVQQVTFPQKAVVQYGEPLASAVLTGQSGAGTFHFKEPGTMLSVSQSGSTQTMVFTPDDTVHYKSMEQEVKVEVLPIQVSLEWYGAEPRVYDGNPSNVRAAAVGLLAGDEAEVAVKNGSQTEPGTYVAEAVSISNENYGLPQSEKERQKQYVILEKSNDENIQRDDDSTKSGKDGTAVGNGKTATATGDPFSSILLPILILLTAAAAVMMMLLITGKEKNVNKKKYDD